MNISLIMKLLGMVSLFKDVTKEVQAAGAEKRPWYMQRSVWGTIVATVAGLISYFIGVTIDANMLSTLSDNIPQLIGVFVTLWGAALSIWGLIAKRIKVAQ